MTPLLLQAFLRIHHTPPEPVDRRFNYAGDRFAFANETVWNYVAGEVRPQSERAPATARRYTRRCFVMVRAALQFWKFARFDSTQPPMAPEYLGRQIRRLCHRFVWLPPLPWEERIVFPGFANLREISASAPGIFQDHLGAAWPVYLRVGNFPICLPVSGKAKARLNDQILRDLRAGYPTILWLYNFPSLDINHTVLVYDFTDQGDRILYRVYDPNYADAPKELVFTPSTQLFTFEPTFYFKGGPVTPRAVYRGFFE
ncbi:MAG: hypothetical protein LV479_06615 [Methylacidiphilales bacterium]|nr:hypothetical protein [Candidatus Methylacidiphilales bacterium]